MKSLYVAVSALVAFAQPNATNPQPKKTGHLKSKQEAAKNSPFNQPQRTTLWVAPPAKQKGGKPLLELGPARTTKEVKEGDLIGNIQNERTELSKQPENKYEDNSNNSINDNRSTIMNNSLKPSYGPDGKEKIKIEYRKTPPGWKGKLD